MNENEDKRLIDFADSDDILFDGASVIDLCNRLYSGEITFDEFSTEVYNTK